MLLTDRRTVRVLLVDDEEAIRLSLSTFLTRSGYDVDTAGSASQALAMLESGQYSLMLSDIRMPGMTGVELVPRALASNPDLAIVMLTAVNDAPSGTESRGRGAMSSLSLTG
jgi:CheY-like chemotaxis protein